MPSPESEAPLPPTATLFDPTAPPAPVVIDPDSDPNLLLQNMIAKRKAKKKEPEKKEEPQPETSAETEAKEKSTDDAGDALAKALGFRQGKVSKPKLEPKHEEEKPPVKTEQATVEDDKEKTEPKTTVVAKKKPVQQSVDPVRVASEAATAATREAMRGLQAQPGQPAVASPADALAEEDRHEYEVAEFLAKTNPKFKNAPQVVLSHVKKANDHAARWEQQNPGKVFDPEDDEHADFFDALDSEKPWSPREFRKAENKMDNAPDVEEQVKPLKEEIEVLKRDSARNELITSVQQAQTVVAGLVAKAAGDDILDVIVKDGFHKLNDKDPITANELARTMSGIQPLLETMIHLDDPKGRIPFDNNNPMHHEWLKFLNKKESEFRGQQDGNGRMFATRYEYRNMDAATQSRHYYLDVLQLASELVSDATSEMTERIKTEKERQKKIAESLGYIPKPTNGSPVTKSDPTLEAELVNEHNNRTTPTKPVSPQANGSVPIDSKATAPTHGVGATMAATHNILFGR